MLTRATLKSRNTSDGWDYFKDEVPIGKVYWVDLATVATMECGSTDRPGETVKRQVVWIFNRETGANEGWAPLELLELDLLEPKSGA